MILVNVGIVFDRKISSFCCPLSSAACEIKVCTAALSATDKENVVLLYYFKETRLIATVMYDFFWLDVWLECLHTSKHNFGLETGCGQQPIFFCGIISNKWM